MRPPKGNGNKYSENQRYKVVALYKLLGSISLVSQNTGLSTSTIKSWKSQDWWKDAEYDISQEDNAKTNVSLHKIRDAAMGQVLDRIEKGDYMYDGKTGQIIRKPINANIVNKIMNDAVDKSLLIAKMNSQAKVIQTTDKLADRLLMIAEKFRELAHQGPQKPLGEVFEGELVPPPLLEDLNEPEGSERFTDGQEPENALRSEGEDSPDAPRSFQESPETLEEITIGDVND